MVLTDARLGGAACQQDQLTPKAAIECRVIHQVNLDDVAAGTLTIAATADAEGAEAVGARATLAVDQHPALALDLIATDGTSEITTADLGDEVTYVYTVRNSGDVPLQAVTLADDNGTPDTPDDDPDLASCGVETLAVGSAVECRIVAAVTYADVAAGSIERTVVADSSETEPVSGSARLAVDQHPALALDVVATDGTAAITTATANLGDSVTFNATLRNTGDISLTAIEVRDDRLGAFDCDAATLAVGASMTCTATGTVTADDVLAGTLAVSVTVDAAEIAPVSGSVEVAVAQHPRLSLDVQSTDGEAPITSASPGQTVTYQFTVANTGDVPLTDVNVTGESFDPVSCPATELAADDGEAGGPDETVCTVTYTVTEDDAVAGEVGRRAVAAATAPRGGSVSAEAEHVLPVVANPALEMTLTASNGQPPMTSATIGQTVALSYTVHNAGDVAVADLVVSDERLGVVSCPQTVLAAGATMTCTTSIVVEESDVTDADGTRMQMSATVTGMPVAGEAVSATATTAWTVVTAPKLELETTANATTVELGDEIAYTFTLTNSGDLTLTGVSVTEPRLGTASCPATTVAVGATLVCTDRTTVTSADVAAGRVQIRATATSDQAAAVSDGLTLRVVVPPTPAPTTQPQPTATAVPTQPSGGGTGGGSDTGGDSSGDGTTGGDSSGDGTTGGGSGTDSELSSEEVDGADCEEFTYQEDAQAVLDQDLSDPFGLDGPIGPSTHGEPNKACEHLPSRGDTGSGGPMGETTPDGQLTGSPTPTATPAVPKLKLELVPNMESANLGDEVSYTYVVSNVGNVELTDVTVLDDKTETVGCPVDTLEPGVAVECGATSTLKPHEVTLEDVARGKLDNVAT
ncbi:MAG: hypothetical protein M3N47_08030, partial [Chloroflexota bacterium]|nr:hypothetical protein [Chloroflexota bacterium]